MAGEWAPWNSVFCPYLTPKGLMVSVSCFLPFSQVSVLPDGQQEHPLKVVSNVSGWVPDLLKKLCIFTSTTHIHRLTYSHTQRHIDRHSHTIHTLTHTIHTTHTERHTYTHRDSHTPCIHTHTETRIDRRTVRQTDRHTHTIYTYICTQRRRHTYTHRNTEFHTCHTHIQRYR